MQIIFVVSSVVRHLLQSASIYKYIGIYVLGQTAVYTLSVT